MHADEGVHLKMPSVSRPWLPASLRKHVEYPTYLRGRSAFSNHCFRCMAHSGCSEVAMRYLSSPSPASTAMTASQSRVECIAPMFKVPAEPASPSGNAGSFCYNALENKSAAAMCTGVCISRLPLPTGQQKQQPLHHSWMLL